MASKLSRNSPVQLTDWQLFTNNGNFNNPLPPGKRLKKRNLYYDPSIDADSVRSRCRTARSRNQSAISTSTSRILSARSVNYRRTPRAKPFTLDLNEGCERISICPSTRPPTGRVPTANSQRPQIWTTEAWSFSHLHRAIIAIDEQARKDYEVGRIMNALAAWQNALIYCEELSQRTQLWPENKAAIDEEIARLRRTYKKHLEEIMKKNKNMYRGSPFLRPTRTCTACRTEQPLDQFYERLSNSCQHIERAICNNCIHNNAKSLLETSGTIGIACPEPHCSATLNVKDICQLFNTDTNAESTENQNRQVKNRTPERKSEFVWCAHEGCGSGQFHVVGQTASPVVTCILCKHQTCAIHRDKWHKGMTCDEYDQQHQVEVAAAVEVAPVIPAIPTIPAKPCPRCQSNIEQTPDSNQTVCSKCRNQFCWECMADYKPIQQKGPHLHKTTCSQYEDKSKKKSSKSSACIIL